ncbi:MAG: DUF2460 domain-containing protein [Desulfobaccales bacterium]|jgi:uncharacterized protein (TIGR02217 family)
MSNAIFPMLRGFTYPVIKKPLFSTLTQESVSGIKKRIANWVYPRWQYEIPVEFLLDGQGGVEDLKTLVGFFLARQGSFDSFLFDDPDDDFIAGQELGIGDGTTTAWQLVRTYGGFAEPIYNPKSDPAPVVYLNGAVQDPSTYAVGYTDSGLLTFTAAPAAGAVITADFGYYRRCIFQEDLSEFDKFMNQLWEHKGLKIETVK